MASLKLISPTPKEPTEYPVNKDSILIGRNPNCDIHLDRSAVSRLHARIRFDGKEFTLEDLHSSNGTLLNGMPIKEKETIYDGDRIRICDMEFLFRSERPDSRRPTAKAPNYSVGSVYLDESLTKDSINFTSQIDLRDIGRVASHSGGASVDLTVQIKLLQTKLDVMMKMMKNLGRVTNQTELVPQFLANILKLFPQADIVSILAPNPKTERLELIDYRLKSGRSDTPVRISRSIPQYVFDMEKAVISDDTADDSRFKASDESVLKCHSCSVMAVPIIEGASGQGLGVIQVESRSSGSHFVDADLDLLLSVANQVAVYRENLRYQGVRRQEEMMAREMELAHQVQQGFLPDKRPNLAGYAFYDFYRPAKYLGGDYFDFIPLPDGRLAIVLADVSGKGIPAALLMAKLSSEVRSSLILEKTLAATMRRLNSVYCDSQWDNRFVTLALIVIEPTAGRIRLFNAGHLFPIRYRQSGAVELLGEGKQGFPIGIMSEAEYEEINVTLAPDDAVILMSDGIPDAMNAAGTYFTTERVLTFLKSNKGGTPEGLGRGLMAAVETFVGTTAQSDDQCLVIFGRTGTDTPPPIG